MSYCLGVDLGTTFTAAAVCQPGGRPEMISLGSSSYGIPSVLVLREDGTFLIGEAAEMKATSDPTRVARYFKRQLGDGSSRFIGGTPFSPQTLTANLLRSVLETVTARQGAEPETVVLTHPANWGPYRREVFEQAASMAGVNSLQLRTEPEAAAINYATGERVEPGELIGVYDLGGGTFDAVIMRRTANAFEVVGQPRGVERLGGLDFDDVIWEFSINACDLDPADLGGEDEAVLAAGYQLRSNCTSAKRLLSADTSADVRVTLPGVSQTVRLTRDEFERRIRPRLAETIVAFESALASGDVRAEDLSRILLVGGSSRIPLVGQLLSSAFGRPLAVDTDPKNTVALGAAYVGTLGDVEQRPLPSQQRGPDLDLREPPDLAPGPPPPPLSPTVDIRDTSPASPPPAPSRITTPDEHSTTGAQPATQAQPTAPARPAAPAQPTAPSRPAAPRAPESNPSAPTPASAPDPAPAPPAQPSPASSEPKPVAESLPGLSPANVSAPSTDEPPAVAEPAPVSELSSVQSMSTHRFTMPPPSRPASSDVVDAAPADVQPVSDRRLPVIAAGIAIVALLAIAALIILN